MSSGFERIEGMPEQGCSPTWGGGVRVALENARPAPSKGRIRSKHDDFELFPSEALKSAPQKDLCTQNGPLGSLRRRDRGAGGVSGPPGFNENRAKYHRDGDTNAALVRANTDSSLTGVIARHCRAARHLHHRRPSPNFDTPPRQWRITTRRMIGLAICPRLPELLQRQRHVSLSVQEQKPVPESAPA